MPVIAFRADLTPIKVACPSSKVVPVSKTHSLKFFVHPEIRRSGSGKDSESGQTTVYDWFIRRSNIIVVTGQLKVKHRPVPPPYASGWSGVTRAFLVSDWLVLKVKER